MALSSSSIGEIRSGGNDTNNGGVFDPSKVSAGGFTDGAATSATGNSPVFTSASYNFVAGDANAWLYIDSGTNWTPGWYQIASVAANAATLSAALGAGVLKGNTGMTTVAGCATTASPTSAKWTIDYSQQNGNQFTYTDLASAGTGLTVSSALKPFAKQHVGNSLVITSGTNFNVGRYVIASISGVTATVVGPTNITTGAGASGVGALGGALLSPGLMSGILTSGVGQIAFLKNDSVTFSITSATTSITQGVCQGWGNGSTIIGYGTTRTLNTTDSPPTLQLNVSTATMFATATVRNIICDGNAQTTSNLSTNSLFVFCTLKNFTAAVGGNTFIRCYATGNSAAIFTNVMVGCVASANTATPFADNAIAVDCISYNNTGASTDGFSITGNQTVAWNCTAYGNGRDGFRLNGARGFNVENCHAENNTGIGFNSITTTPVNTMKSCTTYNNTGGAYVGVYTNLPTALSSTAFTNAGSGDFSLNNVVNGGATLRAAGSLGVFPLSLTTGYVDIGAVQHRDSGTGFFIQ